MNERLRIVRIEGDVLHLAPISDEKCVSCTSPLCAVPQRCIEAIAGAGVDISTLHPGQDVEVSVPSAVGAIKGVLLLVLPAVAFVIAYFLLGRELAATGRSIAGALGLLVGLACGFLVARAIREPSPVVTGAYERSAIGS